MLHIASADAGPAASAAEFVAGLRDEHAALVAFIGLLQAEQDALVQGDADRLGAIAADKAAKLELLTHLGEQRNRHLASQNLDASAAGMLAWVKRNHDFSAAVNKVWQALLVQAEKAQQLNNNNGVLITSWQQQNRLKLSVLQAAAAPGGVYRSDGQLGPLRGARYLSQV